ncbi:MAG: ABC transporter ATP-binding protein [Epsilonproteobacteria bacterium]|nr:ABC transporter ATP-binding protein [Campylobacterota bacterium]
MPLTSAPDGGAPLIEAESLSHAFDYPLFKHLDLQIFAGEKVAVVGVSGSGKSTLLHNLATLLRPESGTVRLFGRDIYALSENERLRIRRKEVGVVFQFHYLFKGMSAKENLEIATLLGETSLEPTLLERLGIAEVIDQRVTSLSGGQQQRVSIARVLAKRPRLIFADEPTGNLDDATAETVMDVMFEYVNDRSGSLFLVTHDETLARRCDRVYRLHNRCLERVE